jgi:hypothetical protein
VHLRRLVLDDVTDKVHTCPTYDTSHAIVG